MKELSIDGKINDYKKKVKHKIDHFLAQNGHSEQSKFIENIASITKIDSQSWGYILTIKLVNLSLDDFDLMISGIPESEYDATNRNPFRSSIEPSAREDLLSLIKGISPDLFK